MFDLGLPNLEHHRVEELTKNSTDRQRQSQ